MLTVDLNCDIGEGMPADEAVFPLISSANIACGGHAGDTDTMRRSIELALRHGVAIGAHPSYPDRAGFGRSEILESQAGKADRDLSFDRLQKDLAGQIGALQAICDEMGAVLHHVKPHGALYNRAAGDHLVATMIAGVVRAAGPSILLYGLSGSFLEAAASAACLRFVSEVFADRSYQRDGNLTPRSRPDALIRDETLMLQQVMTMVRQGQVRSTDGTLVPLRADTVCLHGDGPHAVEFAITLRRWLESNGITVAAPGHDRA